MNPIDIAIRIAAAAHAGVLDKDGYPYILHPMTVGLMGNTDEEKIAGFLHDAEEVLAVGYLALVVEAGGVGQVEEGLSVAQGYGSLKVLHGGLFVAAFA